MTTRARYTALAGLPSGHPFGVWSVAASLLAVAVVVISLSKPPAARAATGHPFVSNLAEAPSGRKLDEPSAVAVDDKRGLVFVGDPGSGYVDVFDSAGAFLTRLGNGVLFASGVAVDEASGDVYVADSFANAIVVFKPDGSGGYAPLSEWYGAHVPGAEFGQVAAVAVDNSASASGGDVYVVDADSLAGTGAGAVDVFKPKPPGTDEALEGELVRSITAGKMELPNGVAVSRSTGRVLVADSAKSVVYTFDAEGIAEEKLSGKGSPYGSFKEKEGSGNVTAVGVDDSSGDILVAEAERHVVSEYSATGTWLGWIASTPTGNLDHPTSVATTPTGDVYVADGARAVVDRFGPAAVVPGVETGKVSNSLITRTSAPLPGTVNGEGKPASYRFQYGPTGALGSETATQSAGAGEQTVSATVQGLQAGSTYFYRVVAENTEGASYGLTRSFVTAPAVEALETGGVSGLQPQSAVLLGSLKRGGLTTHYSFQYGTTTAYGKQSPTPAAELQQAAEKEEKQPRSVQTELAGLTANTLYHYRLIAENSFGTTYGQDRTFTTSGPPRISMESASAVGQTGATLHAQINSGQLSTTYRFQYGETAAYGEETSEEALAAGSNFVARSAALEGLKLGTIYHYRVVATNESGTTTGPDKTFNTLSSAPVDATYATGITGTEVVLHTKVNPLGNDTHVYFQYGTAPCQVDPEACAATPTAPGEDIGAGTEDVSSAASLTGLASGITYHYRAIASNSLGVSEGPERTFTTHAAEGFALADGRAWEMVSPPSKGGAPVEALTREGGVILAAEDGHSFTYVVDGALDEEVSGNRSPELQQVLATRSASGWTSKDIANANTRAKGVTAGEVPEYQFFSSDLSKALVEPVGQGAEPPLAEGVTQATLYMRDNAAGTYLPLVTEANVAPEVAFGARVHFVSASPDMSHVVLRSAVALTGGRSAPGLYEWAEGKLQYVSVLPGGRPARGPAPEVGYLHDPDNAISVDGSRIIWTLPAGAAEAGRGHLYTRDTARGETVRLDMAQGVGEPVEGAAQYQGASSDGSRIFFTDKRPLTPDSTASAAREAPDLYECELVEREGKLACALKDLTVDHNPGEHASVQGLVLGVSADGSSVSFVAQGVLSENANGNGETAEAGAFNLYQLRLAGGEWTTVFLARLSAEDRAEWEGAKLADTAYLTARTSPNGRYLAFMSSAPITGYDNIDASPGANGARDEEVYLYDADTASLRCVSCSPNGARPAGVHDAVQSGEGLGLFVDRREIWVGHWLGGNIPGWTAQSLPVAGAPGALFQSRYLSDDGRLYFNSPEALVPADANSENDVYQYEPGGTGSCESASGGCISLVSSGTSSHESAFLEATPEGGSVFFLTEAQLLPQDTDTAFDIYDARQCSEGSPCLTPPTSPAPACADTDTCRPAPPSQALDVQIASDSAGGAGNLPPPGSQAVKSEIKTKTPAKTLTRAQKLKAALKHCRRRYAHSKRLRAICERKAHRRYAPRPRAGKHAAHGQGKR